MNPKIVVTGVVILGLVGAGAYYMKMKPTTPTSSQSAGTTLSEAAEFAKAIESGKPTTCTLTKDGNTMEYVIKGKMMRANMTTTVAGKTTISHMINDQQFFYMWTDGQKQGSKMSAVIPSPSPVASASTKSSTPAFTSEADYQNFKDQGYTINCKSTGVDDGAFIPPTDINFIDPTEMMKQVTAPGATGKIDYQKLQQQYGY